MHLNVAEENLVAGRAVSSAVHLPNNIAGSLGGIVALSKSSFNRADT